MLFTSGNIIRMLYVNSLKVAIELFEKRSQVYSDRPVLAMVDLMGWDFNVGLLPYGDKWRRRRRLFQQQFKKDVALTCRPSQTRKIHGMLQKMLFAPDDFMLHYQTVAAAIMMTTMYDNTISAFDVDKSITITEHATRKMSEAFFPGAMAVNVLPFLRYLPSWFPGAGFKRFARGSKVYTDQMRNVPFARVKEKLLLVQKYRVLQQFS